MEHKTYESLIKQIAASLSRRANYDLRQLNLTMPQANVLLALSGSPEGEMTFKDMEKRIHMAQSTTASIISRLEKKNLVISFTDSKDRRVKFVRLTDEGLLRCKAAAANMTRTQEYLLSGLTAVERTIFWEVLNKVSKYMD